jgi:hypothetical protein
MGFQTILIAFVADLLSANRKLLEDLRFKTAQLHNREPQFFDRKNNDTEKDKL